MLRPLIHPVHRLGDRVVVLVLLGPHRLLCGLILGFRPRKDGGEETPPTVEVGGRESID